MNKRTVRLKVGSKVPLDHSVFGLRAFGAETILETHLGPLPAAHLSTQHRLRCLDGRYVGVEWVQRVDLDAETLRRYPDLKPVLIEPSQFRAGAPRRGMLVSRHHTVWSGRMSDRTGCFGATCLWAREPDRFRDKNFDFSYITFACERRAFVAAEGLWFAC